MVRDPRYHDTVISTVSVLRGDREECSCYRKIPSWPFSEKALKEQQYTLYDFVKFFIKRVHEMAQGGKKSVNMVD